LAGPSHDRLMAPGGLAHQLQMTTEVEHSLFGVHPRMTAMVNFSRSATQEGPGAVIGEHTDLILGELGFSKAEIDDLVAREVIARA
jgi:crotonobetainyl-CoA:carnitine CoA-transferase CaiB-like acyl-CoA transferase